MKNANVPLDQLLKDVKNYDPNQDRERYVEDMKAAGFVVKTPGPNELFIDIGSNEQYENFRIQLNRLKLVLPDIDDQRPTISRNGLPGRHLIIRMPFTLDPWQRIAYQAALGSDPIKELLSVARQQKGDIHPVLFVEKPEVEA